MTAASAGAARLPVPLVERVAVAGGTVEWAAVYELRWRD